MHATIYGRGQMVLPAEARKRADIHQGDIVEVLPKGKGRILLLRVERLKQPTPFKPKITHRRGRHAVGSAGRPITGAQVRKLLEEL